MALSLDDFLENHSRGGMVTLLAIEKAPAKFKAAVVQAAPVWLDLEGTVAKTITYIEEATSEGAKLIAFPETWIPGYP